MIFNMIASGGGASTPRFGIAINDVLEYSVSTSLSFTNLLGEPQAFCAILVPKGTSKDVSPYLNKDEYMITHFVYDGVEISTGVFSKSQNYPFSAYGNGYNASNNQYSFVYSNGTLTLNTTHAGNSSGAFYRSSGQYVLLYIY